LLCSIMLTPDFWLEYCFWFTPFLFTPTSSGMQLGCKTRSGCICVVADKCLSCAKNNLIYNRGLIDNRMFERILLF
jgi:hypothetical protein